MDSLEPECTPLKKSYDACFNRWFERYLGLSNQTSNSVGRQDAMLRMKREYEKDCGDQWSAYQVCLNKAIEARQLKPLLDAARREDPLTTPNGLEQDTK
ncbi:hypothetical protein CROQUDRAFT_35179 [Cronartium quercuum f. sp. fusiforme G11]|uniref:Uncharacterized protein n=1 Tax=Cronartium quercuum f. sp. fusiforme G11 TaxID=708437 RepID=A0A9P6NVT5_9BASI|nr:hypothetical protein CROQUDRAFT_35179 [Cronartium quercuum f. sp. fusiforme G11]